MAQIFPDDFQSYSRRSVDETTDHKNKKLKMKKRMFTIVILITAILVAILVLVITLTKTLNVVHSTISTGTLTLFVDTITNHTTVSSSTSMTFTNYATNASTTTQNSFACANMTILYGIDLRGSDVSVKKFSNYNQCCAWCLSYAGCKSFTWGLPTAGWAAYTCFLKTTIPNKLNYSIVVSAYY